MYRKNGMTAVKNVMLACYWQYKLQYHYSGGRGRKEVFASALSRIGVAVPLPPFPAPRFQIRTNSESNETRSGPS